MPARALKFWLLLGLAVLAGLLAGCTPPTPPPSPTPWPTATPATTAATVTAALATATATPGAPASTGLPTRPGATPANVTITVWESLPAPQTEQLTRDAAAFQTEFPQYAVALKHANTPEDFLAAPPTDPAGFDVVLAPPALLANLLANNRLAPMSNFFPPSFLDSFAGITLAGATRNRQVWGLPETAGFHLLLFYNKDLIDTPPATTAQLAEQAQKLTKDSRWGLGVNSFDPLWLVPWLTPYGNGWLNAQEQPTLNTPAMVQALTLFKGWHAPPTAIAPVATYDEMQSKFLNGDIALMINGDWAVGELRASQKVNWGVAPLPAVGKADDSQPAVPLVLAKYWAISRNATAERAQGAAAFLEFITRPERQLAWAAKFGTLPTRREALNDPLIANDAIRRVSAAQMLAGQALPPGVNANTLLDAMRDPLQKLLAGKLTPAAAAQQMQANLAAP